MGLDMYLTAEKRLSNYIEEDKKLLKKLYTVLADHYKASIGNQEDNTKLESITFKIGYWRKANAIHKYFVETHAKGVDDCKPVILFIDDLVKLKAVCEEVLSCKNTTEAQGILPTQEGFFFGSTEYDESYREDLTHTINIIDAVMSNPLFNPDQNIIYRYEASW